VIGAEGTPETPYVLYDLEGTHSDNGFWRKWRKTYEPHCATAAFNRSRTG
jgi:hypothetical protein